MNETPQPAHTPEPLPCPFCGGDDYTVELYSKACVSCKCGAFGPDVEWTPEENAKVFFDRAYAAWNKRTGIQDPEGAIQTAREALGSIPLYCIPHTPECVRAGLRCVCFHGKIHAALAKLSAISPKV